jgi:FkbM family methyltransferase
MVRQLREQGVLPRTVVDVGANRGQFMVAACELLKPDAVHVFEPLPDVGELLEKASKRYPEVTVHHVALGSSEAVSTLHVNQHSQSSSLLDLSEIHLNVFPDATTHQDIEVTVERLDQALSHVDLTPKCLLKIDAQGYEAEVIAGAEGVLDHIDWIIAELSFRPLYAGEKTFIKVVEDMSANKFRFERPVGSLRNPKTGEYLQIDALFSRTTSR